MKKISTFKTDVKMEQFDTLEKKTAYPSASAMFKKHKKYIPGGVVSLNRLIDPMRVFVKAKGSRLWDLEGHEFIDYHGAFSPYLLGHGDSDVDNAVIKAIRKGQSLMGAGTTPWEGELAELLVNAVPGMQQVQITNTGSEATFFAIRIARASTEKDGIIIMQGGYNGWHNDVAFNLMDPAEHFKDWAPGEPITKRPFSAGIPKAIWKNVHVVQYNDIEAVKILLEKENISGIILEPLLQNIGVVKPRSGYLESLRNLCDQHGALLIFDEVKTGFRHALGGYQSICGVVPDLSTFGKGVANGYPLGVIGGKKKWMEFFNHPEPEKKVLIAGTYNAHPVPTAAAIATLKKLAGEEKKIYAHLERLGSLMEIGLREIFKDKGIPNFISRQGSAFVVYFMEIQPKNWFEIVKNHDFKLDKKYRKNLADQGIFHFPAPVKQSSISYAHSEQDIIETLEKTHKVVKNL